MGEDRGQVAEAPCNSEWVSKIGGGMWMLKGISVGLGVFSIGLLIYVGSKLGPIEEHKATALSAITGPTLYNPWWWIALIATIALSCWFFRPK